MRDAYRLYMPARRNLSSIGRWIYVGRALREGKLPRFLNPPHNSEFWPRDCVAVPVALTHDAGPLLKRIVDSMPIMEDETDRYFIGWLTHSEGRLEVHAGDRLLGNAATEGVDLASQRLFELDARGKVQRVQVTLRLQEDEAPIVYAWVPTTAAAPTD